jgi:mannitol-1-phosphate/altronate dehydrogenase
MKLNGQHIDDLDKRISVPGYGRDGLKTSLAHIGFGAFHRAHFLTYLEALLRKHETDTAIFEIDLLPRGAGFTEAFAAQDRYYSLLTQSPEGEETVSVHGSILGYANASEDLDTVLSVLSDPEVKLISLTITEKGYCYDNVSHELDRNHPGIVRDLEAELPVSTAIGLLSHVLSLRQANGAGPVTIMSCDNIPMNGKVLKTCITEFVARKYPRLDAYLREQVSFPCTMVDRITPMPTEEDRAYLSDTYGLEDLYAVHSEDFIQWVIQDDFKTAIPDFSKAGATIVSDVAPYELMKIRLLNGSHSALSYPAYLMGYRKVDEAMHDPLLRSFVRDFYMEELFPTLQPIPSVDFSAYADKLIQRFSNATIKDTVLRLASDGSKKISNAIVKPLLEKRDGQDALILALVFWKRFLSGTDEQGNPIEIDDPEKERLQVLAKSDPAFLDYLGISDPQIRERFAFFASRLQGHTVRETLESFVRHEFS